MFLPLDQDELDDGDEGQVMECLVEFKMNTETTVSSTKIKLAFLFYFKKCMCFDQMNSKCRAAVEHFQLLAMKDFRFSAPFKRACKLDITHYCPNIKAKYVFLLLPAIVEH